MTIAELLNAKYACAVSNLGGGRVVFGITDKRPRKVVGSLAFEQPERTRKGLIDRLRINVDFTELSDEVGHRVQVVASNRTGCTKLERQNCLVADRRQACADA